MLDHEPLAQVFNKMAIKLGGDPQFISQLTNDNDWSFCIKLCILTEELCFKVITTKFGNIDLTDYVSRLPLVGGNAGKISLIKSLELGSDNSLKIVHGISEIRNRYAHKIKYSGIDLPTFFTKLDPDTSNQVKSKLKHGIDIIDPMWQNLPKISLYWRLVLESCFIEMSIDFSEKSGFLGEIIGELKVEQEQFSAVIDQIKINLSR